MKGKKMNKLIKKGFTVWFLLSLLTILPLTNSFAGDLGGGGTLKEMKSDFKLNPHFAQMLKGQRNLDDAFFKWMNSLDEESRREIMEKVFIHHIVPQINK